MSKTFTRHASRNQYRELISDDKAKSGFFSTNFLTADTQSFLLIQPFQFSRINFQTFTHSAI